ncbi:polymer-forming cytoskeletal protein [bacterium]|nr:polymer-forming cytoskeletal protein [bacterium]
MNRAITEIFPPTLITEGSRIQGDLTFSSEAQIHGTVEGDIQQTAPEALRVGRNGWVQGSIHSVGPVTIDGRVEGNVRSTTKIRLTQTAQVRGSITAPQIEVRPGAVFDGEFRMKTTASRPQLVPLKAA